LPGRRRPGHYGTNTGARAPDARGARFTSGSFRPGMGVRAELRWATEASDSAQHSCPTSCLSRRCLTIAGFRGFKGIISSPGAVSGGCGAMKADDILREIGDFCRESSMAESTFGRLVVNDGKLTSRLRGGGRITDETLARIRTFMADHRAGRSADGKTAAGKTADSKTIAGKTAGKRNTKVATTKKASTMATQAATQVKSKESAAAKAEAAVIDQDMETSRDFRFFDNRQKYLMFVNTCSEKWVVANRIAMELDNIHPRPPALRLFDAGVGDGTVLTRVMRTMHARFPTVPFYIAGKEISLEDVRLTLEKMADRFFEHPATILVLTNLY